MISYFWKIFKKIYLIADKDSCICNRFKTKRKPEKLIPAKFIRRTCSRSQLLRNFLHYLFLSLHLWLLLSGPCAGTSLAVIVGCSMTLLRADLIFCYNAAVSKVYRHFSLKAIMDLPHLRTFTMPDANRRGATVRSFRRKSLEHWTKGKTAS